MSKFGHSALVLHHLYSILGETPNVVLVSAVATKAPTLWCLKLPSSCLRTSSCNTSLLLFLCLSNVNGSLVFPVHWSLCIHLPAEPHQRMGEGRATSSDNHWDSVLIHAFCEFICDSGGLSCFLAPVLDTNGQLHLYPSETRSNGPRSLAQRPNTY